MPPEKENKVPMNQNKKRKVAKSEEPDKNSLFHDTKKFLQSYRKLELSLRRAKAMQMKRLAANDTSTEWELREEEIEFNDMLLKEAVTALHYVKQMPEMGQIWYHLLQLKYFDARPYRLSDDAIIKALHEADLCEDISKTTFYRYQKSAIRTYGEILWGALDKNSPVYQRFVRMVHDYDLDLF